MKKTLRILTAVIVTSLAAMGAMAQTSGSNSPYSRYGWGTLADESMGFNKGMAGLAMGMRGPVMINRQNPASYSGLDSINLVFDAGISLQNCLLRNGGKSINAQNSTVDYLAAAFRLARHVGFSLGLRPYSYVGYSFSTTSDMDDVDGYGSKTSTSSYTGDGGFRQIYAGVGWSPVKPLSVGMNINYIWGEYNHSSVVSYSDAAIRSLSRKYTATIDAPTLDFGFQFEHKVTKKDIVTIGASYGLGHKINQRATFINSQTGSGTSGNADTTHLADAFQLPNTVTAGFVWNHASQWTFGADYSIQFWEKCRFPELAGSGASSSYRIREGALRNRHKVTAGVEFVPNPRGLKMKDHICYRAGVSYTTPYTKINYKDGPEHILVSLGAGIPIWPRKYENSYKHPTYLNISAQWEHADAKALKGIKEDYLRLCVGVTFNAKWFDKWKFE